MSSQTHRSLSELPAISSYASAATKTLAHINNLHQQIKSVHSLCLQTQNQAERIRKFKLKLTERSNFFEMQAAEVQLDDRLTNVFERTYDESNQVNEESSKIPMMVPIQPKILLPEIEWVIKVLEQITQDNFNIFKQKIEQEKNLMDSLQGMHSKYWQKLKKVEEKLAKGYAEVKSKKRYL